MSSRRTLSTRALIALPLALFMIPQCTCGDDADDGPAAKNGATELYKLLFAKLPKADVSAPAQALPADLTWVAASPDAEAWRTWAEPQPFVQAFMKTPLFADLQLSKEWRALQGLQQRSAQAAKLTGRDSARNALWSGPTAVGMSPLSGEGSKKRRAVVMVKAIAPGTEALVRFAAAFGTLSRSSEVSMSQEEVAGVPVHIWKHSGRTIAYALFRNLLVAGDDPQLVRRATALAAGETHVKGDVGSQDRLPKANTPGVHLSLRSSEADVLALMGMPDLGISLVADAKAPVVLRRKRKETASDKELALLKYAPESSFFAVVDGASASGALLAAVKARLAGKATLGDIDLEAELVKKLSPGMGLFFTAQPSTSQPGGVLVLAHKGQDLEPTMLRVLGRMSGAEISRVRIASGVQATLLHPPAEGLRAALTEDALLLAMSDEALRAALSAGQAQAPSLKDKSLDLGAGARSGVYLNLDATANFISAFTQAHGTSAKDAEVLAPTLTALRSGGRLFARIQSTDDDFEEGALRVLP